MREGKSVVQEGITTTTPDLPLSPSTLAAHWWHVGTISKALEPNPSNEMLWEPVRSRRREGAVLGWQHSHSCPSTLHTELRLSPEDQGQPNPSRVPAASSELCPVQAMHR